MPPPTPESSAREQIDAFLASAGWVSAFVAMMANVGESRSYLAKRVRTTAGQAGIRQAYLRDPGVLDVLAYYDAATAAHHITVPTLVAPAIFDPAVPPPGQFAVAHAIRAPRELFVRQFGHFPHRREIQEAREIEQRIACWFAAT